jgi:glycosyltransferase involved in cell wall biosynthesis
MSEREYSSPTRPRLCLLFPHVLLGGGETAMMEVAAGLGRHYSLAVRALDYRSFAGVAGAATIRGELRERFADSGFIEQRWQLRAELRRADLVLWYGIDDAIPRALAKLMSSERRPTSIRVIHTQRPEEIAFHRRWRRVIDGVAAVSPQAVRQIPGAVFIPNTCSPAHLRGGRRRFFPVGVPPRKTLGFLGRLAALKNVRWLVEHAADLDCNLLVQGLDTEEQQAAELARLAARLGLASRVRFLAPRRDAGTLLRSIDALVIASSQEGFPMVAVEAGMLAVPVISTRVGALPELFAQEILFVDSEAGRPVLGSLRQALAAVEPSWGRRLQEKVRRLCSGEEVVGRYEALLRRCHAPAGR